jgi:hypothetical protein
VTSDNIDLRACKHIRLTHPKGMSEYDIYIFFLNITVPLKKKTNKVSKREMS